MINRIIILTVLIFTCESVYSQNSSWWFLLTANELPIVEGLPEDEYYIVNNFPTIGTEFSNLNIKRDSDVLMLGTEMLNIYQGGAALIEGKNISLLHARGAQTNAIGLHNRVTFDESGKIRGSWAFNGQSGPSLISSLKNPRHFRVSINKIDPAPNPGQEFKFRLYVDGQPISNFLVNTTSVDVYGKDIVIRLESWPPFGLFKVFVSF